MINKILDVLLGILEGILVIILVIVLPGTTAGKTIKTAPRRAVFICNTISGWQMSLSGGIA
jgi:hypothetical protein